MPIAILEQYDDGLTFVRNVGVKLLTAQPDGSTALAGYRAVELAGKGDRCLWGLGPTACQQFGYPRP